MITSVSELPDPEVLYQQLVLDVKQFIVEKNLQQPLIIGIRTGGAWLAQRLQAALNLPELGILDISFYRDDFDERGLSLQAKGSELPDSIEDRDIILVDDVLMSGRTIRAAMNEIFDYGRPTRIHLVCLLDIGQRQLPIQADLVGATLELKAGQKIKLSGPNPLALTLG
ncbi:MAG: bifunctional pyr operon transcriptional regulator/uracil phosphoribosyltransferase PyrR [Oleispira antarctica]|uniref:Bifunctional protein pyrR [Pyrimidine operon regulatory protein Uracil phosphoribosyltransferase] n=1 Tax=Oleispira antarctica RB-8 TaxID=698738 RepID=R4YJJ8_OLEAN|nr:bifunctional pyr operon transcriptional regulator/uracil phosphoribosyltransferase PyrR [Oleispira antarctica]MBQ0793419.1 bifunctional pyr operon transcriptional regulator/uracil phosphoribosyltransferase PyrR [Oleispira antarctica]CCK74260.1 Bifunctional protein pyrR [Pyrimidine operon regulatory protein; Uracil phosphoribosyltransferase] [Oleispira antarctica RB-8]|tara:strand:+ start:494 stop:1000 length:507 start_codon:yes stop_codon:yes gene_type:complete